MAERRSEETKEWLDKNGWRYLTNEEKDKLFYNAKVHKMMEWFIFIILAALVLFMFASFAYIGMKVDAWAMMFERMFFSTRIFIVFPFLLYSASIIICHFMVKKGTKTKLILMIAKHFSVKRAINPIFVGLLILGLTEIFSMMESMINVMRK